MIITIDGPVASGKSTIARKLAQKLDFWYLNTGLMFRAVAYLLYTKNQTLGLTDLTYTYSPENGAQMLYKDSNITPFLKSPDMDQLASQVATQPKVRTLLLTYQQQLAQEHNVVAEGRDTGTVVFPQAEYKFFITASVEERAKRWQAFQHSQGKEYSFEESIAEVTKRDARDKERALAPLVVPEGAQVIDTTNMTIEQAVEACLKIIGS